MVVVGFLAIFHDLVDTDDLFGSFLVVFLVVVRDVEDLVAGLVVVVVGDAVVLVDVVVVVVFVVAKKS